MAVTLKQVESAPASYPAIVGSFEKSYGNAAIPADHNVWIWQRIEGYIAHRFFPRVVVWTAEGSGAWEPPLTPATIQTVEVWEMGAWVATTPNPSPYGGFEFCGDGPYRITADVGGGTIPPAVNQAADRLANYIISPVNKEFGPLLFATSVTPQQESEMGLALGRKPGTAFDRQSNWMARAIQLSGAADLLRPYRRA